MDLGWGYMHPSHSHPLVTSLPGQTASQRQSMKFVVATTVMPVHTKYDQYLAAPLLAVNMHVICDRNKLPCSQRFTFPATARVDSPGRWHERVMLNYASEAGKAGDG